MPKIKVFIDISQRLIDHALCENDFHFRFSAHFIDPQDRLIPPFKL